jgi:hypothetical protein
LAADCIAVPRMSIVRAFVKIISQNLVNWFNPIIASHRTEQMVADRGFIMLGKK